MTTFLCYANLFTRKMTNASGGSIAFPPIVEGDTYVMAVRFLDVVAGALQEIILPVRTAKCSIGTVFTAPTSGSFTMKIGGGGSTSASIKFNQDSAILGQIINALTESATYGGVTDCEFANPSCWIITFNHVGAVPLQVSTNTLDPVSFVRVRAFQQDGVWRHEIRLIQAPVVSVGTFARVLAPAPTIKEIVVGSSSVVGLATINVDEVQSLTIDPRFRGSFKLVVNGLSTSFLSESAQPTDVQNALNNLGITGASFQCTNPFPNEIYIDFGGPALSGVPQPLMTVSVGDFQPGDITFTIDTNTAELYSATRQSDGVKMAIEVEIGVGKDGEDPAHPDMTVPTTYKTLFREPVTINREINYRELNTIASIDWQTPPQPDSYVPFDANLLTTGVMTYTVPFGDGAASVFHIDHNLGTTQILTPLIAVNTVPGAILTEGVDYTLQITSANRLTITMLTGNPRALNSLYVTVNSAGPETAYATPITILESQVTGLIGDLAAINASLSSLTSLLPAVNPGVPATGSPSTSFTLPEIIKAYFGRLPTGFAISLTNGQFTLTSPPAHVGLLLPCVNASSTTSWATSNLPTATANTVWVNTGSATILVPGGGGRRSNSWDVGDFLASDGTALWVANKSGTSSSYFPADFEQTLFEFPIPAAQLRGGMSMELLFNLSMASYLAATKLHYQLVLDFGTVEQDTSPGAPASNLKDILWGTTPALTQDILITEDSTPMQFGLQVIRAIGGTLASNQNKFNAWTAADAIPSATTFIVRGRVINFDIEDNTDEQNGMVLLGFTGATITIQ
jgi:hypothetical protein